MAGTCDGSSTSSSTSRPTRTCEAPSNPSAGSARSTVCPCGSRIPSFGLISTRAFMRWRSPRSLQPRSAEPVGERLARDPLVRVLVALPGALHHLVRQRRRRRRLVPAGRAGPVAHVLLVERGLGAAGLVAVGGPEARRGGWEDLVAHGDPPPAVRAELELG